MSDPRRQAKDLCDSGAHIVFRLISIVLFLDGLSIAGRPNVYSDWTRQGRIQADAIDANASVREKIPMHSSVRFLPQIMRNNTLCENTRLIIHKFQQS